MKSGSAVKWLDEISDLDNDLSYVKSVERFVAQAAAVRAA